MMVRNAIALMLMLGLLAACNNDSPAEDAARELRETAEDMGDEAGDALDEMTGTSLPEDVAEAASEAMEDVDAALQDAGETAEDAASEAEDKARQMADQLNNG